MFVGYPNNTSADTFRMLSLETNYIIKSRGILWLNETIGTYQQRMSNEVSEIIVPPSPVLETTPPVKVTPKIMACCYRLLTRTLSLLIIRVLFWSIWRTVDVEVFIV